MTTNQDGHCVAVTRTDDDGRILKVIWEGPEPPIHPTGAGADAEWVLVPREPTDEMLSEGHAAIDEGHKTGQYGECPGITWGNATACYKAMLASSPRQRAGGGG